VRVNLWPFYLSWFLSFGMIIALSCSERLRKQYPLNICFLVCKHPTLSLAFYIFPVHLLSKYGNKVCSTYLDVWLDTLQR